MNLPKLVRDNPLFQGIFVVSTFSILLIATAVIRYGAVIERFTSANSANLQQTILSYMIVEIALLFITIACILFIWFFLLQGRLSGFIFFNFQRDENTSGELVTHVSDTHTQELLIENQLLIRALELGHDLSKITNLEQLLNRAVNRIQDEFNLYHAQIYLSEHSAKTLTLRAGSGRIGDELVRRGHRLAIGTGSINGTAAQRRDTIIVSDITKSDLFLANNLLTRTRSELSTPLIVEDRFLGVLNVQSVEINGISTSLQKALEGIANQISIAINHNKELLKMTDELKRSTEQSARLTQSGWQNWLESISGEEDLTFYQKPEGSEGDADDHNLFMASSIMVSGAEIGNIHIETDSNRHWGIEDIDLVRAVANQLGQRIENLRLLNESDRFRQEAEIALRQLTHQNWGDFTSELEQNGYLFDGNRLNEIESFSDDSSDLQIDLTIRGEKVGEIAVNDEAITGNDRVALEAVAEGLSSHLENLRLTDQTRRQVFELALLNRINAAMSAEFHLADLIEIVGNEIREGFGASSTFIAIYNRETNNMEYPYFMIDGKDGLQRYHEEPRPRGTGFSSQVIQSAKPLLISRNPEEMIRAGALVVDYGEMPHSYLGVPIIFGNDVLGVLSLQNGSDRRLFSEKDKALMVSVANSMALTLQNSALFTETQNALEDSEQRRQELLAINSAVADTTAAVTVDEAIDKMGQKLLEITDGNLVSTAMTTPNAGNQLVIISERSVDGPDASQIGVQLSLQNTPAQKSVIETQKIFISQTEDEQESGPRLVILPIIGQSGAIGTVKLVKDNAAIGFSEAQIRLSETIVYQVSTVLENKQLLSETRNRALREKKVRAITDRIRRGTDQRDILRIAKEELSSLVGANQARSWIGPRENLRVSKADPNQNGKTK